MNTSEELERALEHHRDGRLREAADGYQRVLRTNPNDADCLYLYGCLAQQTGNYSAACDLLGKSTALRPEQEEYHFALGLARSGVRDDEGASQCYRRTLELAPQHAGALAELEKFESAAYWYSKGCAANDDSEFLAARNYFVRAVDLAPDWLEARHNLGRALYELGHATAAFSEFTRCAEMERPGSEQSRAMLAVIAPGVPELGNAQILETRKKWVERGLPPPRTVRQPRRERPWRVGYVSSFFSHDNWMKPVWGLINQHNREAVHVHLFSDCGREAVRNGYRSHQSDRYLDTSTMSNAELAALVEQCEIDILVDLNGYSNMRRLPLFSARVAPVMIGWFNMYATTGMSTFDYLIGDSEVARPEEEQFYSEKLLRVSGSYLTFDVSYPVPEVAPFNKREFVFGACASQYKITDEVVSVWSHLLRACPTSSLLLKNKRLASPGVRQDLTERFLAYGIASHRVQLEGPEEHFEFLKVYGRMHVALDTFPYNGGTTTTEAIWQGVPVVAFSGDRWASRTSASILRAAGLGEFVADDLAGYVALAVKLGNADTRDWLDTLRFNMRDQLRESMVCNTKSFAREMEQIYEECISRVD